MATLTERIAAAAAPTPRTCRTPGCERSAAWPRDPAVVAAYCRDHTDEIAIGPREPEPEWMARVRDGRTRLARDFTYAGGGR